MSNQEESRIVEWGQEEAARANHLESQQADAEKRVRQRFAGRLTSARGLRRLAIWCQLRLAIRTARKRVSDRLAPLEGNYLIR